MGTKIYLQDEVNEKIEPAERLFNLVQNITQNEKNVKTSYNFKIKLILDTIEEGYHHDVSKNIN